MKRHAKLRQATLLVLCLLLTGCNRADREEVAPSATYLGSLTPPDRVLTSTSDVARSHDAPNVTYETQPAPSPESTPELPETLAGDFLWNQDFRCELPCFNNLEVGVSTRTDVQQMLDRVFDFRGYQPASPEYLSETLPENMYGIQQGWGWSNEIGVLGTFGLLAVFEENNDVLQALSFTWLGTTRFNDQMSVQQIWAELGEPSEVFISLELGGVGGVQTVTIQLVMFYYDIGVGFIRIDELPVTDKTNTNGIVQAVGTDFCFDRDYDVVTGSAIVTELFRNGINELTPVQQFYYADFLESVVPLQEATNLSLQEMARLSQTDSPCLTLNLQN